MFQAFAMRRWLINKPTITTMIPPHCCTFNFSESKIHENIAVKTGMRFTKICARATPITLSESANITNATMITLYSIFDNFGWEKWLLQLFFNHHFMSYIKCNS